MKLTATVIRDVKIPPSQAEVKLWDSVVRGLYLRCFATGTFSWVFRYRSGGGGRAAKARSLKLGRYPAVTIDAARAATKAHAGLVAGGHDPAAVRQENRRRERAISCAARIDRIRPVNGI